MIWPVPLLNVMEFMSWCSSPVRQARWPASHPYVRWSSCGAEALAMICVEVAKQRRGRVAILLPGYFCGQSLRYLRANGIELMVYPLSDNLLPDYDYIEGMLASKAIDIFLHVHYFGKVAGQACSRRLAEKHNAVLVEDCAHVMSPFAISQWQGDYLVFAPHKHFPLPQVGAIFSRRPIAQELGSSGRFPWGWLARQLAKRFLSWSANGGQWGISWSGNRQKSSGLNPHQLTIRAATHALTSFDPAAERRKQHATALLSRLSTISGWQPIQGMSASKVPYLVGMRCASSTIAQRRFECLNRHHRLVMQWPDLPGEIKKFPEILEQSRRWVDESLFFFIHQKLNSDEWLRAIDIAVTSEGF